MPVLIRKGGSTVSAIGHSSKGGTQRLKRLAAIASPRQFTLKLTATRKAHLKVLAVKHHKTLLALFGEALDAFLKAPPHHIAPLKAPVGAEKISVKVERFVGDAIEALAEERGISHQALLTAVMDTYFPEAS